MRAAHQEPGRRVGAHLVAGQLFEHELRIGHVGVECRDHPIAIRPGVGPRAVCFIAVRFAEPHHVEPVSGPALAVARRSQQSVDEPLVGIARRVGHEGLDLLGRRRQAEQIERGAAYERRAIDLGRGLDAGGLEAGQHECVDRRSQALRVAHARQRRPHWLLERPPVAAGPFRGRAIEQAQDAILGPGGARRDPGFEPGQVLGVDGPAFSLGGHFAAADALDQVAGLDVAGHDRPLPRFTAGAGAGFGRQVEPAGRVARAVAGDAVAHQDRSHVALEVDRLAGLRACSDHEGRQHRQSQSRRAQPSPSFREKAKIEIHDKLDPPRLSNDPAHTRGRRLGICARLLASAVTAPSRRSASRPSVSNTCRTSRRSCACRRASLSSREPRHA